MTREALGEAAYAAGEWDVALQEFRALRRMTGDQEWLPVMADCERALGRPEAALRLARESLELPLSAKNRAEMRIVEAGARADLGQHAEALRLLRSTLAMTPERAVGTKVRVGYALADLLLGQGQEAEAVDLFAKVARWDTDGETDAAERVDTFGGMVLEVGDWDDDEDDEGDPDDEDEDEDDPADADADDEDDPDDDEDEQTRSVESDQQHDAAATVEDGALTGDAVEPADRIDPTDAADTSEKADEDQDGTA